MAFRPPNRDDLITAGSKFGITLSDHELETYESLTAGSAAAYDAVERLYAETAPPAPTGRSSSFPAPADNPLGAWYARTEIPGAASGPLQGLRVAIKDNISVAGVPMMNGSRTVEGYVPKYDATVVTRLLEAGATVVGKSVCESLCFSGASHTSDSGPVRNPWDTTRTTGGSSSGSTALVAMGGGQTLLAFCLHDISVALDYLVSRPDVDSERIGFIGHSYGGRTALWAAAFDQRIKASVSHCGCIPYRLSFTHDTGIQAEFVVPGFAQHYDVDDVIACFQDSALLISATTDDRWSRGAQDVFTNARHALGDNVELALYDGRHVFTPLMRERAYQFLAAPFRAHIRSACSAVPLDHPLEHRSGGQGCH